jgi:antitoxin (DNA-binding transcriptional repressor) of toxin-antitoxin stability system
MKTVTFDEARAAFEKVFQLAANGETVVIQRNTQRVALSPLAENAQSDIAPPGHFGDDYSPEEITELNALASHAPQVPVP